MLPHMAATPRRSRVVPTLVLAAAACVGVLGLGHASAQTTGALAGTFRITAGQCGSGTTGSYFRMILPTGNREGPWVENGDSSCGDKTYTLLSPGSDGGLATGQFQAAPSPAFDADGNSLANRIFQPVPFFGVRFSGSTNQTDLQTQQQVPAPSISVEDGKLSGDLSAFAATWNDQSFNQGSPKPGGGRPGNTTLPTGTYDPDTRRFTLTWTSQIVGGPFNNFTGLWHLEGTFAPAVAAAPGLSGKSSTTVPHGAARADAGATATSAPGAAAAGPGSTVAADDSSSGEEVAALPAGTVVEDEGFEPATWLVALLALLGIGGVIALLVLERGRSAA
jgi:hypothetical protein